MELEDTAVLSTAYMPNIQYLSKLILHNEAIIDIHETYLKQSFRNRFQISDANGVLDLSIPVIKPHGNKTKTKDIVIEYTTNWMQVHWRAIVSSYSNSPFFEIFETELAPLYEKKDKFLIDYNTRVLDTILSCLEIPLRIEYSKNYIIPTEIKYDFRNSISPKARLQKPDANYKIVEYYQVFKNKYGFCKNLSFLDLMLNEGPEAISILRRSSSL